MISPVKRGMCVEYEAVILFTKAGFEVFHNANADGPADLVVWDGTNTYLIDCKKTQMVAGANGTRYTNFNRKNHHPDVHILGSCEDAWIWLSEPPEGLVDVLQIYLTL